VADKCRIGLKIVAFMKYDSKFAPPMKGQKSNQVVGLVKVNGKCNCEPEDRNRLAKPGRWKVSPATRHVRH
jgi:hypothetical protein